MTKLVALSTDLYPRKVAPRNVREVEISNQDLGGFVGARACVVKEQEKKMIALPLRTLEVWGCEECIYFGLLQINAGGLGAFLERYDLNPAHSGPLECQRSLY